MKCQSMLLNESQLEYQQVLQEQIFGKLIKENTGKNQSKLFKSPRVRNPECQVYFSVAYVGMMTIGEVVELQQNEAMMEQMN